MNYYIIIKYFSIEHYKYYNFDWYTNVFNDKCLNKLDG